MVVDDSDSRKEFQSLLSASPYNYLTVSEAGNAQRGLFLLKQEMPHIVVFDLALPDMDGIYFGKKVLELSPNVQIVALSHLQMFETVYQAINAGFTGYLLKPIIKSELYQVFERIVQTSFLQGAAEHLGSQTRHRQSQEETSVDLANPIDSVMDFIEHNYGEPISLQDVSDRVYLSPSYFSRLFKAEVGVNFTEYLTHFRIKKSKMILRVTSLPVEVVATNCGFSNASYFSTIFKRMEGRTPTEYRSFFAKLESE